MPTAATLNILCAGGFRAAMEKIALEFQILSSTRIVLRFGTPAATREVCIKASGFDVAVVTSTSLNMGARAALGGTFVVAKSPVGIGFSPRTGARPVATQAEFVATIRSLQSIGLSDPEAGTQLGADILAAAEKLGLADDIRARATFVMGPGSVVSSLVAKNEIDAVMTLVSEIMTVAGVIYGGPVPDAMGLGTPFEAAVARQALAPDIAQKFLDFLRTDDSREKMRGTGLVVLS